MKRAFSLSVKVLHSRRAHSPFGSRSRFFYVRFFRFSFLYVSYTKRWKDNFSPSRVLCFFLEIFFTTSWLINLKLIFLLCSARLDCEGLWTEFNDDKWLCHWAWEALLADVMWSMSNESWQSRFRGFMDCVTVCRRIHQNWFAKKKKRIINIANERERKKIIVKAPWRFMPWVIKDKCKEYLLNVIREKNINWKIILLPTIVVKI